MGASCPTPSGCHSEVVLNQVRRMRVVPWISVVLVGTIGAAAGLGACGGGQSRPETLATTTSTTSVSPTTTSPPVSGWPVRTITSTGFDRDLAPTSSALYWMQGPDAVSAEPVTTMPVRYDLVSGQVTKGAAITGLVGSGPALTVTGGWVWVVVGEGSGTLAEQLDLSTLAVHATHTLVEAKTPYPPSPVLTATVDGPLWVAAGEDVWALSATTGAVETSFTTGGAVASMSTDPTGTLLYVSSQLSAVEGGEIISEYSAHGGRLLHTRSDSGSVGPGTVAATVGGVWVSVRGGNAGGAYEMSSDGLKIRSSDPTGFRHLRRDHWVLRPA